MEDISMGLGMSGEWERVADSYNPETLGEVTPLDNVQLEYAADFRSRAGKAKEELAVFVKKEFDQAVLHKDTNSLTKIGLALLSLKPKERDAVLQKLRLGAQKTPEAENLIKFALQSCKMTVDKRRTQRAVEERVVNEPEERMAQEATSLAKKIFLQSLPPIEDKEVLKNDPAVKRFKGCVEALVSQMTSPKQPIGSRPDIGDARLIFNHYLAQLNGNPELLQKIKDSILEAAFSDQTKKAIEELIPTPLRQQQKRGSSPGREP